MLHRSVKLAYVLCVALGTLLALTSFHAFDEFQMTDAPYQVRVDEPMTHGTAADARAAVVATARSTGADVARFVDDVRAPDSVAHLYAVPGGDGGPVAGRLADGYAGFSRYTDVRFHPYEEVGDLDPRGYYLVWGEREDAQALLGALSELGMGGVVAPVPGLVDLPLHTAGGPLGRAALVTLLAVVVLVGAGVVMGAPAYGVQRLQGRSYSQILLRDVREVSASAGVALGLVAVAAVAGLGLYNGFARFGAFVVVAAVSVGALLAVALVTHALALALLSRSAILPAVKGEFPSRLAMAAMYLVRVPAVVLVAVVGFAGVQAYLVVEERAAAREAWADAADTSSVLISGTADMQADPELFSRVGAMAREAVDDGAAIVVADVSTEMVPGDPRGPFLAPDVSCPVLAVSPSYLDEHEVLAAGGVRLGASDVGGEPTLLLAPGCGDDVRSGTAAWLAGRAGMAGTEAPGHAEGELAPDQDFFTYGDRWNPNVSPWAYDAALLVLPAGLEALSDSTYGDMTAGGEVLFLDQDDALERAGSADLRDQVAGVLPAGAAAAKQTRQVAVDLRTSVVAFVGVLGVVAATAVGVVMIHARRRAQEIYVRHICGWRFWRAARSLLVVELGLAVLAVLWSVDRAASLAGAPGTADALRSDVTAWYVGIATAGAVLGWLLVAALARSTSARLVRTRSADT
ncbi:hypothetical protein [Isoptericola rhizosphaerae]|uniref:hypothetical protein n=1 Tax=Isoptericola rhizosphaerae TaxID=3377837 RepID=UPI00383B56EF